MNKKGFTLVELLVAISILAILTVLAIPTLRAFQANNNNSKYTNYGKSLETSAKLYTDSYSEDIFGEAPYGCQTVSATELLNKKVAKDIALKNISCNISAKDSYVIIKKFNNEYSYDSSLYCEDNSNHSKVYSDDDKGLSSCINNNGIPDIDAEYKDAESINSKNKSVVIKLIDIYGFTANQEIEYAWSTEEDKSQVNASQYKEYKYNNNSIKTTGKPVELKSKSITIPGGASGKYYLYVKPIRVQNIINNSATEIERFGPFRFDHEAPKCEYFNITPNVSSGSYSKEVYFDFSYDKKLDDLKSYTLNISYDNGAHWTAVNTNGDYNLKKYTIDKDGDIKYQLTDLVDQVGNKRESCPIKGTYHRDTKPPTCTLSINGTKSSTSNYYHTTTKVKINSSELNDCSYDVKNTNSKSYQKNKEISFSTEGSQNAYGFIKDRAGNEGNCSASFTTTSQHKVTFDGNGGTATPTSKNVYWGDEIGTLASASRPGYSFGGWFTTATGGSQIKTSDKMGNSNVTYYAHWTPNYTITVLPDEGTADIKIDGKSAYTKTVPSGTKVTLSGSAIKYYQISSWSNGTKGPTTEVTVDSNKTISVKTRKNKIVLHYNTNGGILIPGEKQRCPELAGCKSNECTWPQFAGCRQANGLAYETNGKDYYDTGGWADEGLRNHCGAKGGTIRMKKGKLCANRYWIVDGKKYNETVSYATGLKLLQAFGGNYAKNLETQDVTVELYADYSSSCKGC